MGETTIRRTEGGVPVCRACGSTDVDIAPCTECHRAGCPECDGEGGFWICYDCQYRRLVESRGEEPGVEVSNAR